MQGKDRTNNQDSFLSFIKKYGSLYFGKKSGAGAKLQHQLCLQSVRVVVTTLFYYAEKYSLKEEYIYIGYGGIVCDQSQVTDSE